MKPNAEAHPGIQKDIFLKTHNFSEEQFASTGLEWALLEQIYDRQIRMSGELQTTGTYVLQRLQSVPSVHSLNLRIKSPSHLIAKIIRKKLEQPDRVFELSSYESAVTDLIGIRALHLFKNEWQPIHEFVTQTWELHEKPIAYVREGDGESLIQDFTDAEFEVKRHPFGYRSIHYLVKSQPAKCVQLVELQVRTIFEEGWSEIDHRVRYPRQSGDPYLAEFLTIFNRLAGSADEMGTFIQLLGDYMRDQTEKMAASQIRVANAERELKQTVSRLQISEGEKKKLQKQIDELHKTSNPRASVVVNTGGALSDMLHHFGGKGVTVNLSKALGAMANVNVVNLHTQRCTSCGNAFGALGEPLSSLCPDCAKSSKPAW